VKANPIILREIKIANTPAKAASRCSVPELPRIRIVKVLAWTKE